MRAADLPLQEATMRVAGNFHPEWAPPTPGFVHGPHRARSEAVGAAAAYSGYPL